MNRETRVRDAWYSLCLCRSGEPEHSYPSSESKRMKERERRKVISDSIINLRNAIPLSFNSERQNQVSTMTVALKYIRHLQDRVAELECMYLS